MTSALLLLMLLRNPGLALLRLPLAEKAVAWHSFRTTTLLWYRGRRTSRSSSLEVLVDIYDIIGEIIVEMFAVRQGGAQGPGRPFGHPLGRPVGRAIGGAFDAQRK